MRVAFRTDASIDIGTGHVMRCLTLANALAEQGMECTFICRAHLGHLGEQIVRAGHHLHLMPLDDTVSGVARELIDEYRYWLGCTWQQDAVDTLVVLAGEYDWLIVDHYGLDALWEAQLRPRTQRIMAIDDLANRQHDCDLLLDQNPGRTPGDYKSLVGAHTCLLMGPRYALVRPEFADWRPYSLERRRRPQLKHILVSMGGVDKNNVTGQVLAAFADADLPSDCRITVVMGAHAPWLVNVREQVSVFPRRCDIAVNVANMAELMADSDLAIGAAGGSAWERCVLGLPSLICILAENQSVGARFLEKTQAAQIIDGFESIGSKIFEQLKANSGDWLACMSRNASRLCDGNGAKRIVDGMYTHGVHVRPMCESDLDAVLRWRNHPDVRAWMYTSHEITKSEHREWFGNAKKDPCRYLLIVEDRNGPIGFVQFARENNQSVAAWGFYVIPGAPPGSGQRLGLAALAYAFKELRVREIRGEALVSNDRSLALHKKLGFHVLPFSNDEVARNAAALTVCHFQLKVDDWIEQRPA